jgi:hypothetical protein
VLRGTQRIDIAVYCSLTSCHSVKAGDEGLTAAEQFYTLAA